MLYINKNRPLVVNNEIIEWDIKSANLSLIKEFSLLSESEISKIPTSNKEKREKHVGMLMRDNKEFNKALESKFNEVIEKFIELNSLDKDYDIVSIKKDAVFVVSKNVKINKLGSNILYVPKNVYHAYIQLPKIEFYFKRNEIEVKGISKDFDEVLFPLHKDGILYLLREIINICEKTNMNSYNINIFMKDFVEKYKMKELDFPFYREFNQSSKFRCNIYGQESLFDDIDESLMDMVNIEYNYIHIILPLIRILC
jgi:hypothetical protein